MLRATVKGLLAHKLRLLLTALSVVFGVGFVAGTYVLTDTLNATFDTLFEEVTAGVDVSVRAESGFGDETSLTAERNTVPADLLDAVADIEGVAAAEGAVGGFALILDEEGEAITTSGAPTLGVNWIRTPELTPLSLRAGGSPPNAPDEVVVDATTARDHDIEVGDEISVIFQGPTEDFEVVGITGFGEADNLAGATLAVFETETAQRVFGKVDRFDSIDVSGDPAVSVAALRSSVAAAIPDGYEAVTGAEVADEQAGQIQQALGFFSTFLLVFAGISLFVGAFLILNTFSILVAQRTRELALLRALGASRAQVLGSVIGEAAIVGAVASAAGLGLGIVMALGLKSLLGAFGIDLPGGGVEILPRTIVVSILTGFVVTILAALGPARRASKVPPMAALVGAATEAGGSLARRTAAGVLVLLGGLGALAAGLFGDGGIELVGVGAGATFIAVALLLPLLADPMATAIGWPLPRLAGISGKLGRQNAKRNPRRTAATAAALTIGLGLVGCMSVLAASVVSSTSDIIDRTLAADYVVSTDQFQPTISTDLARGLREQPELGAVTGVKVGEFRVNGSTKQLAAGDPDSLPELLNIEIVDGEVSSLDDGDILLEEREAEEQDVGVGDTLAVTFARTGGGELRVGGTYEPNQLLGTYTIAASTYEENFTSSLDFVVVAKAAAGVDSGDARAAVEAATEDYPNVTVRDQAEFKEEQKRQINQVLGLVTALLGLAIAIAFFGIINTLALSVFERTRELGLLRAVGLGRRQVRSMIRSESVIIAVMGAVVGLAVGLVFGIALVTDLSSEGVSTLEVPIGQLVTYVVVAGILGVIAAVFPARRAAKLDVLDAISHE